MTTMQRHAGNAVSHSVVNYKELSRRISEGNNSAADNGNGHNDLEMFPVN